MSAEPCSGSGSGWNGDPPRNHRHTHRQELSAYCFAGASLSSLDKFSEASGAVQFVIGELEPEPGTNSYGTRASVETMLKGYR